MLVYTFVAAEHVAAQQFNDSSKETKTSAIPWLKHESELRPEQSDPYSLKETLSGDVKLVNSVEKKHTQTHTITQMEYRVESPSVSLIWEGWVIKNQV